MCGTYAAAGAAMRASTETCSRACCSTATSRTTAGVLRYMSWSCETTD